MTGVYLQPEVACGNHPSLLTHINAFNVKFFTDVVHVGAYPKSTSREFHLLELSINQKLRFIRDLKFTAPGTTSSVSKDTCFDAPSTCELGHVLWDPIFRALFLHQLGGPKQPVILCRFNVKDAYRQVQVDPKRAPKFAYGVGEFPIVDMRLQFGGGTALTFGG